jgi:hypothetical protein
MVRSALHRTHSSIADPLLEERMQHDSRFESTNTGDDTAIQFVLDQYSNCLNDHIKCRPNKPGSKFQPTRLIDVGHDHDGPVRLCEQSCGDYVTLSHCWGITQHLTLKKKTSDELHRGISIQRLPKTFQDAIAVARRLRIQYIWIDSL